MIENLLGPVVRARIAMRAMARARANPVKEQAQTLARLVSQARDTRFGRAHGFGSIRSVADYRARVPLRRYEDFWQDWWRTDFPRLDNVTWPGLIRMFASTSGTSTGRMKYIPLTPDMLAANRLAGMDLLAAHFAHYPQSRAMDGKSLMLGGSTALRRLTPDVLEGDLSGIMASHLPWYAEPMVYPSRAVSLLSDWDEKIARIAQGAVRENIRILSGTPSWVLILLDRMKEAGADLSALQLLIHGGVRFDPYRPLFEARLGTRPDLDWREVYPASEGFIASADLGPGEGLRLHTDTGLFFEFVPLDEIDAPQPRSHWLDEIEVGVQYAVVLTTCAGLWRYVLGDTVRFVSRDPPRLLVTGRLSSMISAFGEHLIGEEIDKAVAQAAQAQGAGIVDYTIFAVMPQSHETNIGHHRYYIESEAPLEKTRFARDLDQALKTLNDDYDVHRAGDFGMGPPEIIFVRPGAFAGWMQARGRAGGQNKVPRVLHDAELQASLESFMKDWRT